MTAENTVARLRTMMLVAEMRLPRRVTDDGVEPTRFTVSRDTNWPDPNNMVNGEKFR